jgi:hypothetical protein
MKVTSLRRKIKFLPNRANFFSVGGFSFKHKATLSAPSSSMRFPAIEIEKGR